ncbi:DUF1963 domain-containing protein [bacterium]|nr:DUF1963 domain-containing protein [bacterium]
MWIFDRLFRKRDENNASKEERNAPKEKGLGDHLQYLNSLREPAVRLDKSREHKFSRIGGLPDVPDDFVWPSWKGKPLSFLCQLDLSEIPRDFPDPGTPRSGFLYVFYDQEQSTCGGHPKEKGSWYLHYSDRWRSVARAQPPKGLRKEFIYKRKHIRFCTVYTYPDAQDPRVATLGLSDAQLGQYEELCFLVFGERPMHHLFGYPSPIQSSNMGLECELASHGLHCGGEIGREQWTLLLQLDTDDDTEMMWHDDGRLYFWIKKKDLKEKRFEDTWMLLQSC